MLILLTLMITGFTALCCSMPRHTRVVLPKVQAISSAIMGLRIAGWLALLVAIVLTIDIYGFLLGLVWFFGLLPIAIAWLAVLLNIKPRLTPWMLSLPLLVGPGKLLSILLYQ